MTDDFQNVLVSNCPNYLTNSIEREIKLLCSKKLVRTLKTDFFPGVSRLFDEENSHLSIKNISSNKTDKTLYSMGLNIDWLSFFYLNKSDQSQFRIY